MIIALDVEEKRRLWRAAHAMAKAKRVHKPGSLNNPLGKDPRLDFYEGLLGEAALAKILGLEINTEAYEGRGDGNTDLEYKGLQIDVKATSRYQKCALLVRTDRPLASDLYFLCFITEEGTVRVGGGATKDDVLHAPTRKEYDYTPLNYRIPYDGLRSIRELIPGPLAIDADTEEEWQRTPEHEMDVDWWIQKLGEEQFSDLFH